MALIELTEQEHALLESAYNRAWAIQFASDCKEALSKVQRDILATAMHCKALLDAGKSPILAADFARNATYLTNDIGRFSEEKMILVRQAAQAVYGYPPEEIDLVVRVLGVACQRLNGTAEDGSTIAADVTDVLDQFAIPPTIWS